MSCLAEGLVTHLLVSSVQVLSVSQKDTEDEGSRGIGMYNENSLSYKIKKKIQNKKGRNTLIKIHKSFIVEFIYLWIPRACTQ